MFEALLTAVSLKNQAELEKDAQRIEDRRAAGLLSEVGHRALREIIETARSGDWEGAEARAYAFRELSPYFD